MIDKQMKMLVEQSKKTDPNDDSAILDLYKKKTEVLCANLDDTIAYINSATPDELYYVSEVYDEISAYWKSERLIKAMVDSAERCPKEARDDIMLDINFAKKAMKR